jgi:hypothetical protein
MPKTKNSPPKIKIISCPDFQRTAPTSWTPTTLVNKDSTLYARLELWELPQAKKEESKEEIKVHDCLEPVQVEVEESPLDHILCPPEEPIDALEETGTQQSDGQESSRDSTSMINGNNPGGPLPRTPNLQCSMSRSSTSGFKTPSSKTIL